MISTARLVISSPPARSPGRGDTVPRRGWAEAGSITIRQASQFHRWCQHPYASRDDSIR
jgi:hypothetical protein